MIKIEKTAVMNILNAVRGARNPLNSWSKSDSGYSDDAAAIPFIGSNDLKLLQSLCKAGSDHRKFMRQIFVSADITAPLYWWKEFDTYKVGTTANSTSTMHKIHSKPISIEDFSCDCLTEADFEMFNLYIAYIENLRLKFIETNDKSIWDRIIQMLPCNYHQLRTVTCSYENLLNMYYARKSHKLSEWRLFCNWIETLPYAEELIISIKGPAKHPNHTA